MNVQIKRKIKIIEEKKFKDFHIGLFLVIMLFTILLSGSTMIEKEVYARELSTEEVEVLVSENIIEDTNEPTNIVTSENSTDVEEITIEESHPNEELDGMDITADYIFTDGTNKYLSEYTMINTYSGLSVDDMHYILEDIPELYPYAQVFYDTEQRYCVNALFMISVASLESAYGKSNIANNHNNLFGFMRKGKPMSFSNKSESIDYFGKLLSNHYVPEGLNQPVDIAHKYEPKDPSGWSYKVADIMNTLSNKIHKIK